MHITHAIALCLLVGLISICHAQTANEPLANRPARDTSRGDHMIAAYFRAETAKLRDACLAEINSREDWESRRGLYRQQLMEMLGLDPAPERTDLKATITGTTEHAEFIVERLHFQSRPGLYVTANLYVPRNVVEPLPAILYVCGHARVEQDGVSLGNKAHYQHHAGWFARNGYVCLVIDTLQLGEIAGIHHGTYRENMWWWLNRGYTPAGVEAWNCVRALDYLETRSEVDARRIGVTGRSGGGAYSWWIAAIDDRIQCAVPVAGITDLQNHVVAGMPGRLHDGCVEGHCDCMYMFNTYRWDYPQVAALVAPRPLLISNTDSDSIFPLDGVYRTFESVRRIYRLYDAADKVALQITAGGHNDTQELRIHAFHWFNHYLKGDDSLITTTAEKLFEPAQLRVFEQLPADSVNGQIQETFVPAAQTAQPSLPGDETEWDELASGWMRSLRAKTFAAWPADDVPLDAQEVFSVARDGLTLRGIDYTSQQEIRLRLYVFDRTESPVPERVVLHVLDNEAWMKFVATMAPAFAAEFLDEVSTSPDEEAFQATRRMLQSNWAMAYVAPRGIGPTAWDQSEQKQIQHRRRFYLLGQSLDGMRVLDVRRAIQALRAAAGMRDVPLSLEASGSMAGVTLYASLFEPEISRLDLHRPPTSHREGPFLLNVRRFMDLPQAVALAAAKSRVVLYPDQQDGWDYPLAVAKRLGWGESIQLRQPSWDQP